VPRAAIDSSEHADDAGLERVGFVGGMAPCAYATGSIPARQQASFA
jgi:hypothetical protein